MKSLSRQITMWLNSVSTVLLNVGTPGIKAFLVGFLLVSAPLKPVEAEVFDCTAGDVECLIDAINAANANDQPDTINLEAGEYILNKANNDTEGLNGLPSITSAITLTGASAESTVIERDVLSGPSDPNPFRIFHIATTGELVLEELTVQGGTIFSLPGGGGILNDGTLNLNRSGVKLNGRDVYDPRWGGGIYNRGSLSATKSTISENSAGRSDPSGGGGGLYNAGTATLIGSTVHHNRGGSAVGHGGGIKNSENGTLTLIDSTISNNIADLAGGISNDGLLNIVNSTISGNIGGGFDARFGGGLENRGQAMLINSTISGNSADNGGSSILNRGNLELLNSTVVKGLGGPSILNFDNSTIEFSHTIIEGSCDNLGEFRSFGFNLSGFGESGEPSERDCTLDSPGDQIVNPDIFFSEVLGPLQDNGGPTKTHALLEGSPAINTGGDDCPPPDQDQRGQPRPHDGEGDGEGVCDIGAFEFQGEQEESRPGDVNNDGCIDRADANIVLTGVRAGSDNPEYDINQDGTVNRADARTVVRLFDNPGGAPCE
jgi:dockerin type I repeat protein